MLNQLIFKQYSVHQLSPEGWLRKQLEIQGKGLSGNLDKVWPDVKNSKWIGGDKEGWERVPYWLDGFIPLAWLLDDEDMKARAKQYIDAILKGQQEDGWICPCGEEERGRYDMWALFLICKVLVVYHDCTEDPRIEDAVYRALAQLNLHIERHTVFNWAATRWYECLIPLYWLMERKEEEWMLELAHKLEEQGVDYEKTFHNWRYSKPHPHGRWSFMTHVVNLAMMLKSRGLFSRISNEDPHAFAKKAIEILLRDHGMAVEHFTGDECLSGTSPIQGLELCSVTEAMYSYEWLIALTGESEWSDRLEKLTFNALPATISPDMWSHQYDQMTNQVECSIIPEGKVHFRTNGPDAHLFGLEPNYGCCTANFNQGWPKFALSTMMEAADGVAITAIAPCKLNTKVNGVDLELVIRTDYPFEDGYQVIVKTAVPVEFTLYVRIPGSARLATVDKVAAESGFYPVKKEWSGEDAVAVSFEFDSKLRRRPSGMNCVWRGPLLYSLPIEEEWEKLEYTRDGVERKYPYCDYQIFPRSKWNYAFWRNQFDFNQHGIGKIPFDPNSPPVSLTTKMIEVDWGFSSGVCDEKPKDLKPIGKPQLMKLIPYGCTNLRMTEMPLIDRQ